MGLFTFIVVSALLATGSAPAQTSSTRCSPWKTDIPNFQYHECLVTVPSGSGAWVRTGLQIMNRTTSPRDARMVQRTIINGRVVGTGYCPAAPAWQQFLPNAPATCWEPSPTTYRLVPWGGYAYGNGTITDRSSGRIGETSSPLLDLR